MKLNGQVAIVTGGGRGIGRACALRLADEGAKVAVAARNLARLEDVVKEIEAKGGEGLAIRTDVSDEASTLEMAEKTIERFGRIDILVNNAAFYYGITRGPFYELSPEEWDKVMAVGPKGAWLCARAVFPYMKKEGKGKIIDIASGAFWSAGGEWAHYIASKGATIGLTRALARELGGYGINVNTVAPGVTMTEATRLVVSDKEVMPLAQRRAIKRPEEPDDVLGAVIFLASSESDFITGQTIIVDGGTTFH